MTATPHATLECKMAPDWTYTLPEHIRLTAYQIERLELIRSALGVSHEEFHFHVLTHPECSKMLQRLQFARAKSADPGMADEFYLLLIVLQRLASAQVAGGDLFGLRRKFPDSIDVQDPTVVSAVVDLIRTRGWVTIDDLANAIADDEADLPEPLKPHPSSAEARRRITLILKERLQDR